MRTGGVPHRLNDDERLLYDLARQRGYVEISGSGWRRQRSDAPLVNTYRSWCDARAIPAVYIHKGSAGDDEVVVDLSPLRAPAQFEAAAAFCLSLETAGGTLEAYEGIGTGIDAADELSSTDAVALSVAGPPAEPINQERSDVVEEFMLAREAEYSSEPLHRLPKYTVAWLRPRPEAKGLAKMLAEQLGTAQPTKGNKGRSKSMGGPRVKPGKSRRHGGYGIG